MIIQKSTKKNLRIVALVFTALIFFFNCALEEQSSTPSVGEALFPNGENMALSKASSTMTSYGDPANNRFDFGTGDFSICFWIKTTKTSGTIIDKRGTDGYLITNYYGTPLLQMDDPDGYNNYYSPTRAKTFSDGSYFHHVAITVDRNETYGVKLYIDGVATDVSGKATWRQGSLNSSADLLVANNASGMLIRSLRIEQYEMSVAQVKASYDEGSIHAPANKYAPQSAILVQGSNEGAVEYNGSEIVKNTHIRAGKAWEITSPTFVIYNMNVPSISSVDTYVEVVRSDSSWNVYETLSVAWAKSTPIAVSDINAYDGSPIYTHKVTNLGAGLTYNTYYRVKIATLNNNQWRESVQLIHYKGATPSANKMVVVVLKGAGSSGSSDSSYIYDDAKDWLKAKGVSPLDYYYIKDAGDTVCSRDEAEALANKINDSIQYNGGIRSKLNLLVIGRSAGGVKAWNTFKRHYGSITGFNKMVLFLIDPHGSATYDDRTGTYGEHQNLYWPDSGWSTDTSYFRVYNMYEYDDWPAGANFPAAYVNRKITGTNHDAITTHPTTVNYVYQAIDFLKQN